MKLIFPEIKIGREDEYDRRKAYKRRKMSSTNTFRNRNPDLKQEKGTKERNSGELYII